MVTLQRIAPENVYVFKTVRLCALQDSPSAFGSTFAKEALLSDEEWVQRSIRWTRDGSVDYLAFDGENACGLVACYTAEAGARHAHVVSMWVDPAHRRAGVRGVLIEAVKSWAASGGLCELRLMVTSVNLGAIRFYERLGFRRTGNTEPYPNDPAIVEYEMACS